MIDAIRFVDDDIGKVDSIILQNKTLLKESKKMSMNPEGCLRSLIA